MLHNQSNLNCIVFNLLRIPLSDIITSSYLAASYPGCMLFIFGLTPTFDPPVCIRNMLFNCNFIIIFRESKLIIRDLMDLKRLIWIHLPINSVESIIGYFCISVLTTPMAGSYSFSIQNRSSYCNYTYTRDFLELIYEIKF